MTQLQVAFTETISKNLKESLGLDNSFAVPRLTKIIVNMGVRDALSDKKSIENAKVVMGQITGQKPKVTKAKKSISNFKLREGDEVGLVVTMRGKRMYNFFDKLVSIVIPRFRDFHGLKRTSFDGHGNYTMGFVEFTVFPEIDQGKTERVQGLEIVVVTTAKNDTEGMALLEALGIPFQKTK